MLLPGAKNKFLQYLFNDDLRMLGNESNTKKMVTLASQFKKSLDLLMAALGQCNPFFVRCVKPNEFKKPMVSCIFCHCHDLVTVQRNDTSILFSQINSHYPLNLLDDKIFCSSRGLNYFLCVGF